MRTHIQFILFILCITLFTIKTKAQTEELVIDLAQQGPGTTQTETIDAGKAYSISLDNRLPNGRYNIVFEYKRTETEAIDIADFPTTAPRSVIKNDKDSICELIYSNAEAELKKATTEQEIKRALGVAEEEFSKCADQDLKKKLQDRLRSLVRKSTGFNKVIEKGHELKITITTTDGNRRWIRIYKAGPHSNWKVLIGFTYVPNWMTPVRTYYASPDTGSTSVITPGNSFDKFAFKNITPTAMFTWTPYNKYEFGDNCRKAVFSNNLYQFGITGGISLDLTNPSVMASPSLVFGDILSLNFGTIFTPKYHLAEQYYSGQRISGTLTFDQLHEKSWYLEYFASIAIRFKSNPFKENNTSTEVE